MQTQDRTGWTQRLLLTGFLTGCLIILNGCVPPAPFPPSMEGNVGVDPADHPHLRLVGEPNDTFDQALDVYLDENGRGMLRGWISTPDDVDVFALHGLAAGDRLIVDVASHGSGLDAMAAVFDEAGRLMFENDDRNIEALQLDPFLNEVIRRDSSVYFLALARSPLAHQSAIGGYEVLITVVYGGQVPEGQGHAVVLNFEGGSITLRTGQTYTTGPFDAADIAPIYAGQTWRVRDQVAWTVRDNYEGLALDVRVLPGDPIPGYKPYSFILFGGSEQDLLGIAQHIDAFNSNPNDGAIVFTENFTPSLFGLRLTADQLGVAIGNVASHELGHLLGLHHVANVHDIMDTTGNSRTLLADQRFLDSPLHSTIFPIGTQDSWLLLLETLGWAP